MHKGKLVYLAPLTEADSASMFAWINERDQVLFNAPYRPVHEASHQAWFKAVQQRSDLAFFGIHDTRDDRLIGSCQLHDIHPVHRSAELQIRIGEAAARGRGAGSETVHLLLDFAFQDLNLERVFLHVFAGNEAAVRTYEKAGFMREGLLRKAAYIDGQYVEVIVMGILRGEHRPA